MNLRLKLFLFVIYLGFSTHLSAQENEKTEDWGIKFGGFIKSDYWFDSRKIGSAREDLFALYPLNESFDKDGNDINAKPSFNFTAITSRLSGKIKGPDAFGAKTSGLLEADFSGMSNENINTFRLRHAFLKLKWEKQELLFGQFWHPMFVADVFPSVISLNTGVPFQPFNRSPQVRYTYSVHGMNVIMAAIAQRDYANEGPAGRSNIYMRNSLIPNLHGQIQYKTNRHTDGVAFDYKVIMPQTLTDSSISTNERVSSYSLMMYYKQNREKSEFKFKAIYGQNMSDLMLMGGYAVASIDTATGIQTYTPTKNFTIWANYIYGKKVKIGVFGGFTKNLGTKEENIGIYYARGSNIAYLYRIAPSISFVSEKVQLSTEIEYTSAAYGIANNFGVVKNVKEISNIRLLFSAFYFF